MKLKMPNDDPNQVGLAMIDGAIASFRSNKGWADNKIDDEEFARKLLDELAKSANIDPKRVFATGMSNGGIMSYLLASELSDRIAAIAPVGGPMGTETCKPKRPVSANDLMWEFFDKHPMK